MSTITVEKPKQRGETLEIEDFENDLIRELGRRLGCVWQFERYLANAAGHPELPAFWRDAKAQEQENIEQIKRFIQQYT